MPLPLLIGGIAAGLGILGHSEAKKTNEKAEKIAKNAENIYYEAENKLTISKEISEKSLLELGYCKKNILDTSIKSFLKSYSKIKKINFKTPMNFNELEKFNIKEKDVLELVEMNDIYDKTISTGVVGAATGGAMALAAGGSLGLVSGGLSLAGSALSLGQVGLASSFAGAALTPLAIVAAPIVLFTGISSSLKADKNLEKARVMFSEAEVAVGKMETSIILCDIITEKSEMFNSLLNELNIMFSKCTILLNNCVNKNTGFFKGKEIDPNNLSEDEKKLLAISRSLCGAIKSIIDAPLLNQDGKLHENVDEIYNNISEEVVNFNKQVLEIKSYDNTKIPKQKDKKEKSSFKGLIFIILMGLSIFFGYKFYQSKESNNIELSNTPITESIEYYQNGRIKRYLNGPNDQSYENKPIDFIALNNYYNEVKKIVDREIKNGSKDNIWQLSEDLDPYVSGFLLSKNLSLEETNKLKELQKKIKKLVVMHQEGDNFEEVNTSSNTNIPSNETNNKYTGPERNQFIFLNGKTVFIDENGYITE